MSKYTLLFTSFFLVHALFGQERNANFNTEKRFLIGVAIAPHLGYRKLEIDSLNGPPPGLLNYILSSRNELEKTGLRWTFDLNILYRLSPKFDLETGLQFSQMGYNTRKFELYSNSTTPDPALNFSHSQFKLTYNYLSIPSILNFTLGKKRTKWVTSAGLNTSIYLYNKSKSILYSTDGNQKYIDRFVSEEFNKIGFYPSVAFGVQHNLAANATVRIQPYFKMNFIKLVNAPIAEYTWNTGIKFAYFFSLN